MHTPFALSAAREAGGVSKRGSRDVGATSSFDTRLFA